MIVRRWLQGVVLGVCFLQAGAVVAQNPPPRDLRLVEHAVELAWMADPITFPYDLRAYLCGGVLEIQGVVPNLTVRKQAVNIARLHYAKTLDQTDLAPADEKAFVAVPAERVAASAQAAIARALPQLASTVAVKCDPDGVVALTGAVSTHAEKTSVSELMRRVPGCLRVDNALQVAVATIQQTIDNSPPPDQVPEQMRAAIAQLCPQAAGISVLRTGPESFLIQFAAPDNAAANQMASNIFSQQAWKRYRLDIGANVPR